MFFAKSKTCLSNESRKCRILQAGLAGDVHSYIIAPSAVHGTGTSTIGKVSAFMKFFGGEYVKSKRVFVVGEGTNVLGFVSELFLLFSRVFRVVV